MLHKILTISLGLGLAATAFPVQAQDDAQASCAQQGGSFCPYSKTCYPAGTTRPPASGGGAASSAPAAPSSAAAQAPSVISAGSSEPLQSVVLHSGSEEGTISWETDEDDFAEVVMEDGQSRSVRRTSVVRSQPTSTVETETTSALPNTSTDYGTTAALATGGALAALFALVGFTRFSRGRNSKNS